jgi:hypothetical protein
MLFARIALLVAVCSHHYLPCHGISHHLPCSQIDTQDKADSPPHPCNIDDNEAADDNSDNDATDDDADDDAGVNADNNNMTQMTDNDTDAK